MLDRGEALGGVAAKVENKPAEPAAAAEARARAAQATVEMVGSQARVDATSSQTGATMSMEDLAAVPKGRTWIPQPRWAFSAPGDGRTTLKVQWGPQGFLYLLRRSAAGVVVLQPAATTTLPGGSKESIFTLSLAKDLVLDLYQLPGAERAPTALPETGPIFGFRARIWPPEKKTP